jgi:hypothetical protein
MVRFFEGKDGGVSEKLTATNMSPEAIDATLIQLRTALKFMEGIPKRVKSAGHEFCEALDEWSTALKEGKQLEQ